MDKGKRREVGIVDESYPMNKRVFLGGTCADSKWRNEFEPMLKNIDYFNPVVSNWDDRARKREVFMRNNCDYLLYVLSRVYSVYSIAEVIDDSNKRPTKTICCVLNEKLDNSQWSLNSQEIKHLDQVGKMVERNGGKYFKSLEDVAEYLNNIK